MSKIKRKIIYGQRNAEGKVTSWSEIKRNYNDLSYNCIESRAKEILKLQNDGIVEQVKGL